MKKIIHLLVIGTALTACNNPGTPAVDTAKEQQALLKADQDFSATVAQQGMAKAMEKFYDEDVIAISPNQDVNVGKASVLQRIKKNNMDSLNTLSWSAEKAVVAASGDLGYAWGHYQFKTKTKEGVDTIYYGAYCTIYKKEADGNWKAVMDLNDDTPKP